MPAWLLSAAGGIAGGVIGAIISAVATAIRLTAKLSRIEQQIADQEKRMDRLEGQIFSALRRIEDKIDRKADRP